MDGSLRALPGAEVETEVAEEPRRFEDFPTGRLQPEGELWTIGPDGTGLTRVFEDEEGRFATGPTWSPDGTQILFTLNGSNDPFVHDPNGFYAIDVGGGGLTQVIAGRNFVSSPEWWPEL